MTNKKNIILCEVYLYLINSIVFHGDETAQSFVNPFDYTFKIKKA